VPWSELRESQAKARPSERRQVPSALRRDAQNTVDLSYAGQIQKPDFESEDVRNQDYTRKNMRGEKKRRSTRSHKRVRKSGEL
jgi:hypothetical protein